MLQSYITEKYAGILTREDVGNLFSRLTSKLGGNRSESARQSNLTIKATYDWEKTRYIKLKTKAKVLDACLRMDFLNTVEYLLERSSDRTVDVLRTIMSFMFNEAMETKSSEKFAILMQRFVSIRKAHQGLIYDEIKDEVTDMMSLIKQKSLELEVAPPEKSIEALSLEEWLDLFPTIVDTYIGNPQAAQTLAKTLDLPTEAVDVLMENLEKLRPPRYTTQTERQPGRIYIRKTVEFGWEEIGSESISTDQEPTDTRVRRIKERPLYASCTHAQIPEDTDSR